MQDICNKWRDYIERNLLPLITIKLEGNIYSKHHSTQKYSNLIPKQNNIIQAINNIKPQNILEIGFNARFLKDVISAVDSDEVVLKLSEPNRAGLILPSQNEENEDITMLIMPMMLGTHS